MTANTKEIGLIELPQLRLVDLDGNDYQPVRNGEPLISKQILMASLEAGGFETSLVNLRDDDYEEEYGKVAWKGLTLSKRYVGRKISEIVPDSCEVWAITINFTLYREIALMVIKYLIESGKPVVVGGSDPIADPDFYLQAGAAAVVLDKSGAANWAIFDYVLGRVPREELTGVILANGTQYPKRKPPLHPEEWSLPSSEVIAQCAGKQYWIDPFPETLLPMGSVIPDIGCDRRCDFCQTPTYGTGYRRMSPTRTLEWLKAEKDAGMKSIVFTSDQFLGRVLFPEGREEVLTIMKGLRELELASLWPNGLELRKMTLGRGRSYENTDLTPDEELIKSLYGWDGKTGAFAAYIPAERPINGREAYAKLLPWQQHKAIMRTIVRAGIPLINYGVIIGLPDDDRDSLLRLEEALSEIYQEVKAINASLKFIISALAISPILGTPQGKNLRQSGLLRFEDPVICGGYRTVSADTRYLSYADISDWQLRINRIGDT